MSWMRNPGRVAGLWYLALVILGPLRLIYIPDKLFVRGDAAATAGNIAAHQGLFRLGIADSLLAAVVLVFLVLALYRLFRGVDQFLAILVVVIGGIVPAVLYLVNAAIDLTTLTIVRGEPVLAAFDKPQRDALAMIFVRLFSSVFTASEITAGLWLLPLGLLAFKSRFMPRLLGVWLILGGLAYLILCAVTVTAPQYQSTVFSVSQPAFFGEIAFMLWLVVMGSRPPRPIPAPAGAQRSDVP
jgi:hypothetical protein